MPSPNALKLSAVKKRVSCQIVMANVVNESSIPYCTYSMDSPQACVQGWKSFVESQPDFEPDKESVVVFCLNARHYPFAWHRVSIGTVADSNCHPREVLRPVIATAAFCFVMVHNHPSGDAAPSNADINCTRRVQSAAELMQVALLDHVIIGKAAPGRSEYFSFREAGIVI